MSRKNHDYNDWPIKHGVLDSVKNFQDAVDNSVRNGVVFEKLDRPEDFRAKAAVMDGPMECVVKVSANRYV